MAVLHLTAIKAAASSNVKVDFIVACLVDVPLPLNRKILDARLQSLHLSAAHLSSVPRLSMAQPPHHLGVLLSQWRSTVVGSSVVIAQVLQTTMSAKVALLSARPAHGSIAGMALCAHRILLIAPLSIATKIPITLIAQWKTCLLMLIAVNKSRATGMRILTVKRLLMELRSWEIEMNLNRSLMLLTVVFGITACLLLLPSGGVSASPAAVADTKDILDKAKTANAAWLPRLLFQNDYDVSYEVTRTRLVPPSPSFDPTYSIHVSSPYNIGIVFWTPAEGLVYATPSYKLEEITETSRLEDSEKGRLLVIHKDEARFIFYNFKPLAAIQFSQYPDLTYLTRFQYWWSYDLFINSEDGRIVKEVFTGKEGSRNSLQSYEVIYKWPENDNGLSRPKQVAIVFSFGDSDRRKKNVSIIEYSDDTKLWFPTKAYCAIPMELEATTSVLSNIDVSTAMLKFEFTNIVFSEISGRALSPPDLTADYLGESV